MANAKISDAAFNPTTDITTIDGFAAYSGGANSKISGNDLVSSVATNISLDASKITSGILPIVRGGTGSSSTTYCTLTTNVTGILPIANGGTGIKYYGEACEIFLNTATVGGNSLGNSNNDTTYVAPMDTLAFNDDVALYTPTFNTGSLGAANWDGGIQVLLAGKYLVEGQYYSFDGQNNAQMELWAEVNAVNNPHSASWPTSATAGDIYLLSNGKTSTTLSGNAGQCGSRIITVSANDYVRLMFRHADFSGTGFPVFDASFAGGTVTGLEGYRVRLTITRMA